MKMAKLAIVEEREEDKYEHITTLKCWKCDDEQGRDVSSIVNPAVRKIRLCLQHILIQRLDDNLGAEEDYGWGDAVLDVLKEGRASVLGRGDYRL